MTRNLMKQLDQIVETNMENLNIHIIIKTNWHIRASKGLLMTRGPNQLSCCINKKYLVLKEYPKLLYVFLFWGIWTSLL